MGVAHTRVTLRGTIGGGADNWSTGFGTPPVIGANQGDMEDLALTGLTLFVNQFWGTFKPYVAASTDVRSCVAQQVDAAGHVTVSGEAVLTTPDAGGSSSNSLPPEVAVVVSLRTGTTGPRGRGRMYMPSLAANALDTVGNLTTTARQSVSLGSQTFFNDWNSDPGTLSASVVSNAGLFVEAITATKVGSVFDSQRRRRDRIVEGYITKVITI